MVISEVILLVGNITQSIREIRLIADRIPSSILPSNKALTDLRCGLDDVSNQISNLSNRINDTLPELFQLIRIYSRVISDVRIASAKADKLSEIYGLVPDLAKFTDHFANQIQDDYRRINSGIADLPVLDVAERGNLDTKLSNIRDLILEMRNSSQTNTERTKIIFGNISTQYLDADAILSKLLNRILASLNPRQ
jgi:uncharacterized phage infection (PIP) family protein YhgE